nr:RNA-directed DNA polymerase (reverse transcriptase) and Integrase domain containing protein [Haemonchus contortus]
MICGLEGCAAYLDDVIVTGSNIEEHVASLGALFNRISDYGFRVRMEKCNFLMPRLQYLGNIIDSTGRRPDPAKIELLTEHKPLLVIFGSKKGVPVYTANRLQRWALIVKNYDFTIEYRSTTNFGQADALSRLIAEQSTTEEVVVVAEVEKDSSAIFVNALSLLPVDAKTIAEETSKDPILKEVLHSVQSGEWPKKSDAISRFSSLKESLSTQNGCLLIGDCIFIPDTLRSKVLSELHDGHQGVTCTKMKLCLLDEHQQRHRKLRANMPSLPRNCYKSSQGRASLMATGRQTMDSNTRRLCRAYGWQDVPHNCRRLFGSTTTSCTIRELSRLFAQFGNAHTLVTDNGTQLTSTVFNDFCNQNGTDTSSFRYSIHSRTTAAKSVDGQRGGEGKASQVKHTKGKNSHQQQRSRRKDPKCSMKPVGLEQPEELRSPVVSSEGYDEWETASESSTRVVREDHNEIRTDSKPHRIASFLQRNSSSVHRVSLHSASQTECKSRPMSERFYSSQNGESSSRTCPSSSDSCNDVHNINSNCRPEGVHSIEKDATDGLAGLEINDIAGVAVVDDHSVDVVTADQNDDFEEVMNKRAKKQKAHEMQAKLDAEEKRKAREKERQERTQTKKRARYNNMKKDKRDDVRKDSKSSTEKKRSKELYKKGIQRSPALDNAAEVERAGCAQDRQVDVRRNAPVTTVWNSAHVAEQKELLEGIQATIPSPIARPSPRSKSEASGSPSSIRDLVRANVSASLPSSEPKSRKTIEIDSVMRRDKLKTVHQTGDLSNPVYKRLALI